MAQTLQRRRIQNSSLMTPDPYHVPGYGGFCPQFKFQIGQTFGKTTSSLLDNKDVASSRKLVLNRINPNEEAPDAKEREVRLAELRARTHSWGDQKLGHQMVPGYTGFIPKSQHFFGKRYAENCVSAISDFEREQSLYVQKAADLNKTVQQQKRANLKPLEPICRVAKPYVAKRPEYGESPYHMDNGNPDKRFMSGYTGFVPRSRGIIGSGYPIITCEALNELSDHTQMMTQLSRQPVRVHRPDNSKAKVTHPVYPLESGLVPHYTGHVPGEKFRYGDTFGHSTNMALTKFRVP